MGTFKDIIDTVSNLEGEVSQFIIGGKKIKSLSKASMEGVLNFPVIVSNTISIDDATLVNKALERQFASFALTVMTMNPYLYTMGGAPSASKYVSKFHQNLDVRADGTDVWNAVSNFMQEASNRFDVDYEQLSDVTEAIVYHIYEGVNHHGVNKENMKYGYSISEVTNPVVLNDFAKKRPLYMKPIKEDSHDTIQHIAGDVGDTHINRVEYNIRTTGNINTGGGGRAGGGGRGTVGDRRQLQHLMDNDVKKSNELVPTLLHMRIYPVDGRTDTPLDPLDFVIGVKATLHPVSSEEMIVNVCRGIKNEDKFFNFIRWTTGETKFFKDFVFSMNELKIDAVNSGMKASRWWTMLKRRKALAKIKGIILPNKMLPNATIVITQEETDVIRDQYGYNLENPSLAYKLINNYFLIAFVIIDPALQRVKFLFDGRNEFETQTYASLARESSTNDKQFKEMLNMLGRRI